ncbi:MAG TPA: type IV pilus twitching motility protein PilT [Dehalococcoidales bacterium]|nr:type IV pilus twitching motility protein PilT [Dehalococcoidales bacterium]
MHIFELLSEVVEKKASDLHLRVGSPPMFRIFGKLSPRPNTPPISIEESEAIFDALTTPIGKKIFDEELELDCAYSLPGVGRFRVNILKQRSTLAFAIRMVPFMVPTIDQMQIPLICKELILRPRGLILVTGPTGSGKSTTMAAMIDHLNETESKNIITVEDPIEYLHHNKKCIIAQRDLGEDTKSFDLALMHTLRQDPDVIYIGEMRDLTTISIAIRGAETGHLVLATLHTTDAAQAVDRIIDVFPANQQGQIRLQLSQVLEAVLTQCLLPRADGQGRVAAFEILLANPAVRNLIRMGKSHELPNVMQLSTKEGMQTLDQALAKMIKAQVIRQEDAVIKSSNPSQLLKLLNG